MYKKSPNYTVIIPTHNRAALLHRAINSIKQQKIDDQIEIIVIADVSDEDTFNVCKNFLTNDDIFIKRCGDPGPSASRNIGLELARGKYILFLDDDDAWHPDFLSSLEMNFNDSIEDFLYVNCSVVKERRLNNCVEFLSENSLNIRESLNLDVYVKNQVHMSCYIFPSYLLKNVRFDVSMRAYEDWDFLLSVFDKKFPKHMPILGSRVFEVDDATSDRRGSSENAQDFNAVLDYLYVYRRHPSPSCEIQEKRAQLLNKFGLPLLGKFL